MDKIVGKIITSLVLGISISSFISAQMYLKVYNVADRKRNYMVAGHPFCVEVICDGTDSKCGKPDILGLDRFTILSSQTSMQSINGVQTVSYTYRLRSDEPGTYTIGPSVGTHAKSTAQSNSVQVVVKEDDASTSASTSLLMRLNADKKSVVLGEGVTYTLEILYDDPTIDVGNVYMPEWGTARTSNQKGAMRDVQEHNGVEYNVARWTWTVYPDQVGRYFVPATYADFNLPLSEDSGRNHFTSFFFRPRYERKRIYSNSISVEVLPLPEYKAAVHAIGQVSNVSARVNETVAKEGEGVVLTLLLVCSNDTNIVATPQLYGMPDELKWYESKQSVNVGDNGVSTHFFEYVIQGVKSGNWEIPAQQIVVFDVEKRAYQTLDTEPVMLAIRMGTAASSPISAQDKNERKDDQITVDDARDALICSGSCCSVPDTTIPLWLFITLLALVVVAFFFGQIKAVFASVIAKSGIRKREKQAASVAKLALKSAADNKQYDALYGIFIQFFADTLLRDKSSITYAVIEQALRDTGLPNKELNQLSDFFSHIEAFVFHDIGSSLEGVDKENIFIKAYAWIDRLKKVL